VVQGGVPVGLRAGDLPAVTRPTALTVAEHGGRVRATVRFADRLDALDELDGQRVAVQVLNVLVASDPDRAFSPLVLSYDVRARKGARFDSRGTRGPADVKIGGKGKEVVFDLGPVPGSPAARAGSGDDVVVRPRSGVRFTMTVLDVASDGVELGSPFVEASVLLPAAARAAATTTTAGVVGGARDEDGGGDTALIAGVLAAVLAVGAGVVVAGRRRRGGPCGAAARQVARAEARVGKAEAAVQAAYRGATATAEAALAEAVSAPDGDPDARRVAVEAVRAARVRAAAAVAPRLGDLARAQDARREGERALAACRERVAAAAAARQGTTTASAPGEQAEDAPLAPPNGER
jgi:hypothetical protein